MHTIFLDKRDDGSVLYSLAKEHWATVKTADPIHERIMKVFTNAIDFGVQNVHLFDTRFQLCLNRPDKTEANYYFLKYLEHKKKKYEAFLIPALEDGNWFLIRIQVESRAIFIVDSRPALIRPHFDIVKTVRTIMKSLIPSEWKVFSTHCNP